MTEYDSRVIALDLAVQSRNQNGGNSTATTDELLERAKAFHEFLEPKDDK